LEAIGVRVLSIELGEDGLPTETTVRMSVEEAAVIVKIFGKITPATSTTSAILRDLGGSLFDRFWEDGEAEVSTDLPCLSDRIRIVDGAYPGRGST
jgi:hypothetical protein